MSLVAEAVAVILSLAIVGLVFFKTRSQGELKFNSLAISFLATTLLIIFSELVIPQAYLTVPIVTGTYFLVSALLVLAIARCKLMGIDVFRSLIRGVYWCSWVQIAFVALQMSGAVEAYNRLIASAPLIVPHLPVAPDATGLIFQANQLADFLFLSLLAACYLRNQREISSPSFITWIALAGTSCALTGSRSGLVFAASAILISAWIWLNENGSELKQLSKLTSIASLSFVLIQFATKLISPLLPHYTTGVDQLVGRSFLGERFDLWKKAWLIFLDHPILGAGWGSYGAEAVKLQSVVLLKPDSDQFHSNAHNIILQLLAESGLLTTTVIIGTLLYFGYKLLRKPFTTNRFVILVAYVILGLHSLVEYPLYSASFIFLLVVLLASDEVDWRTLKVPAKILSNSVITICLLLTLGSLLVVKWNSLLVTINFAPSNQPLTEAEREDLISLSKKPVLAEMADFFLLLKVLGLDDRNLEVKLAVTEKLMEKRPNTYILFNRAIFLSYAGREDEAVQLIKLAQLNQNLAVSEMISYFNQIPPNPRLLKVRDQLAASSKTLFFSDPLDLLRHPQ